MSKSNEVWEAIKAKVLEEGLLNEDELNRLGRKVLSGNVDENDWKDSVTDSLNEEAENDE